MVLELSKLISRGMFQCRGGGNTEMVNGLNAGIWGSGFEMEPSCPSGNCTWPVFRSAGWCSKCADITSATTFVGCDVGMKGLGILRVLGKQSMEVITPSHDP